MASKSTNKIIKKVVKSGKKYVKKNGVSPALVIFVIIIIAAVGFLGFTYFKENSAYNEYVSDVNTYLDSLDIPSSLDNDISFGENPYNIVFSSSNETYLTSLGKVNRPNYRDGNKTVTLNATASYQGSTFLSSFLSFDDINVSYNIVINAKEATPEEIVEEIMASIDLPSEVYDSIYLPTKLVYNELSIIWTSNNPLVLDNNGSINHPIVDTLVNLTCVVSYKGASLTRNFDIYVLANDFIIEISNQDFNSIDSTNKYIDTSIDGITYKNVKVEEDPSFDPSTIDVTETNTASNLLKFRYNNESESGIYLPNVKNIKKLSFDYKFIDGVKSDTFIKLCYKDNEIFYEIESIKINHDDTFNNLEFDLNSYSDKELYILISSDYATLSYLYIDNLELSRNINDSDYENLFSVVTNISKSIVLPFTTKYGGKITWESSDESYFTSLGELVKLPESSKDVTLKATLYLNGTTYTYTFTCTLKANKSSEPVFLYFIDLGITGLSDCGESTYIKYKDIDILVDAGDDFESTHNAVKNTIDTYSEDRIIDYLIATHPDSDHIGNMASIFEDYQVNTLYKFNGESFTTKKFKNLKAAYDSEPNCEVIDIYDDVFNGNIDKYIYLTSEIYIEFIDTGYLTNKESNGRSIVFVLNIYGTRILMTGDADSQSAHKTLEVDYMDKVGDIDILKVVHHGTGEGTPIEFLNAVKPELAIICNGNYLGNKHGHPHPTCITNLITYFEQRGIEERIYAITGGGLNCSLTSTGAFKGSTTLEESLVDRNGTITLEVSDSGYELSSYYQGTNLIDITDTTYYKTYKSAK